MNFQELKEICQKIFLGEFSKKKKTYISVSLGWVILIGYLTWWNGINDPGLDKSFRWDEWFWFGIIPATVPYIFYFIWKKRD